jgi:predicted RNA binding protein YcfA (HicA-like mRNA interferase family)
MKSVTGREFARIVERHGWVLLRISGSHHIYGKMEAWYASQFQFTVASH